MSTSTYTLTVLLNHLPCRHRAYSFESIIEIAEPHCYVGRLGVWCAILGEERLWNMLEFWVPLLHLVFMCCTSVTYILLLRNGTWLKLTAISTLQVTLIDESINRWLKINLQDDRTQTPSGSHWSWCTWPLLLSFSQWYHRNLQPHVCPPSSLSKMKKWTD